MLYAGVDTHKNYSRVVVTNRTGNQIAQASLYIDLSSFHEFFRRSKELVKAVIEAGRTWGVIYDLLERIGVAPVVANPLKTRVIAEAIRKPTYGLTAETVWQVYGQLEQSKVKKAGFQKFPDDIISLILFAIGEDTVLEPFSDSIDCLSLFSSQGED